MKKLSRYEKEAVHIIGHVLQKDGHMPDERLHGECSRCVAMIIEMAKRAHSRGYIAGRHYRSKHDRP